MIPSFVRIGIKMALAALSFFFSVTQPLTSLASAGVDYMYNVDISNFPDVVKLNSFDLSNFRNLNVLFSTECLESLGKLHELSKKHIIAAIEYSEFKTLENLQRSLAEIDDTMLSGKALQADGSTGSIGVSILRNSGANESTTVEVEGITPGAHSTIASDLNQEGVFSNTPAESSGETGLTESAAAKAELELQGKMGLVKSEVVKMKAKELGLCLAAYIVNYDDDIVERFRRLRDVLQTEFKNDCFYGNMFRETDEEEIQDFIDTSMKTVKQVVSGRSERNVRRRIDKFITDSNAETSDD